MDNNYIKLIKAILQKTGWTQSQMATEMGVTFAAFNRWLHHHARPRQRHMDKINQLHRQHVGLMQIDPGELKKILSRADIFVIKNISKIFHENKKLIKEFVVDSTYQSNTIEGTTLTFHETEVLIYEKIHAKTRPFTDNIVSLNHAEIVKDIFNGAIQPPYTEEMILNLHKRLFHGLRDDAGHYSDQQRIIMGLDIQLTHPNDIPDEISRFLHTMNQPDGDSHFVQWLAETHANFDLIHPFGDGNGRVGRLLMIVQCLQHHYPPMVIENTNKATYLDALEEAQRRSSDHLMAFFISELERSHKICQRYKK